MVFAVTSVVVAVIVEGTVSTALKDTEQLVREQEQEREEACKKILEIFEVADEDGNHELDRTEFYNMIQKESVQSVLVDIGIDGRQAAGLFDILDYDGSERLDFEEFIEG